jgi:hypothetical protein
MWLFHPEHGFISVVERAPNLLLIRGRVAGDVQRFAKAQYTITTPKGDYLFRAYVDRSAFIETMTSHIANLHYPSFKDSVVDRRRLKAYIDIWSTMAELQDELAPKPPTARRKKNLQPAAA